MKLLRVKASHFKNCQDDTVIDLVAKSKKTTEDKEYELQEIAEGLYVYSIGAFVGKNASGKTTALELLDCCYDILGKFSLENKHYSYEGIKLEIIFFHEGYIYKYTTELKADPTLANRATFSNQHIYKKKYYKTKLSSFTETKASAMGDYIPAKLSFDEGEDIVTMVNTVDYSGYMLFVYENGKVAKVPLNAYETKTNRKKLTGAFSLKDKIVAAIFIDDNKEMMLRSSNNRAVIFDTALLLPKVSKTTVGVSVMTLKTKAVVEKAQILTPETAEALKKYRCKSIPATGGLAKDLPDPDQLSL